MSRRRLRRRSAKERRHAAPPNAPYDELAERRRLEPTIAHEEVATPVVRAVERVERLAYTRSQAAAALGISPAALARRVLPLIETIETPWGTVLVPVDELERLVTECRRPACGRVRARAVGRRSTLPEDVVMRIAAEHDAGQSLGQIARDLNARGVPTAHGGAQWWPSTVRVVLRGRVAARLAAGTGHSERVSA